MGAEYDASWDLDREGGHENTASGLNATARDLARFGQLYLHGGARGGVQILPRAWVDTSTTIDRLRREPEVSTWWLMQHRQYWWIPMQDWDDEGDFFADGSRGQRIYVHPRSRIVIVQLANESAQDFPFRKLVHHLMGEPYRYPGGIPGRLMVAANGGAGPDSLRRLYRALCERAATEPASLVISESGMVSVGQRLLEKPATTAAGVAVLELAVERSPDSYRTHETLGAAYEKVGRPEKATAEYREAVKLSPHLARSAAKRLKDAGR